VLLQRLTGGGGEPDAAGWDPPAEPAPRDLPLTLLPAWSATQEAITNYWITPEHLDRGWGRYRYDPEWCEAGWRSEDRDFLELDLKILDRTVSEIRGCLKRNRRCLVGFSVHSSTMMNRRLRQAYLKVLASTPSEVRPFLLGRIAEVQPGTPIATIADWAHQLRPISQRMAIEIHHSQRDVTGLSDAGLTSVACVLPVGRPVAAEVAALSRTIAAWSRDLKRQNLRLRIDNVDDPRLLALALDGQIDFQTCPRLWPPTPSADGMKPYGRERFLKAIPLTAQDRCSA
jgi:hypothetical protein